MFYIPADPLPPDAPKNLRQGNFTVSPNGSLSVVINWDAPPKGTWKSTITKFTGAYRYQGNP